MYTCIGLHVKFRYYCQVLMKLNFLDRFSKKFQTDLMKIRPVGAELFHADGRTDMTKPTVAFRSFTDAPKHTTFRRQRQFRLRRRDQLDLPAQLSVLSALYTFS